MTMNDLISPYLRKIVRQGDLPPFTVEKMVGDASNREYFRVKLGADSSLKSLVMMKFNPENAYHSEEASDSSRKPKRFAFTDVLGYLDSNGIRVPHLYASDVPKGVLFLEDLGDTQMFSLVDGADREARRSWYRNAVDTLVEFQQTRGRRTAMDCIAFGREFDYDLLMWEFEHYTEWGIEHDLGKKIDEEDQRVIRENFDRITRELLRLPKVLVHRDYQSRNIMVQNGKIVLIDFQDALLGPWPYDLVALLRDSYVVLSDELVDEMMSYYLDRVEESTGHRLERDYFQRAFLLQTIQRKLKDSGRFVFIDRVKKNPSFLPYIPDSLAYVRWAFSRLEGVEKLAERLGKYEERLLP